MKTNHNTRQKSAFMLQHKPSETEKNKNKKIEYKSVPLLTFSDLSALLFLTLPSCFTASSSPDTSNFGTLAGGGEGGTGGDC